MKTPNASGVEGNTWRRHASKFTDAECFNCGKKGHTYRYIEYAAAKGSQVRVRASGPQKPQKAHTVTTDDDCLAGPAHTVRPVRPNFGSQNMGVSNMWAVQSDV